jgi:methionyl aminopeptidase
LPYPQIKTPEQINAMRQAGHVLAKGLQAMAKATQPGISTYNIDQVGQQLVADHGMECAFLGQYDFPAGTCISVNDEVVHGLPKQNHIIAEGDVVKLDFGVKHQGMVTDACITVAVGPVDPAVEKFLAVTKKALFDGIAVVRDGARVGDISQAIQTTLEAGGASVCRQLTGHGLGEGLHEPPEILNFGRAGTGPTLLAGHTIAIEPIATLGGNGEIYTADDKWTICSRDGTLGAHYEFTIVVTEDGCEILTPWHEAM